MELLCGVVELFCGIKGGGSGASPVDDALPGLLASVLTPGDSSCNRKK